MNYFPKCYFRFSSFFRIYLLYPPSSTPCSNHSEALVIFSRYHTYHFFSFCFYIFAPLPEMPFPLPIWRIPRHPSRLSSLWNIHSMYLSPQQVTSYISLYISTNIDIIIYIYKSLPNRLSASQRTKRTLYLYLFHASFHHCTYCYGDWMN